ncbi:hypothetical protein CVV68_21275 [Arthrobacter livingstonensis]|uniref:Uncharacterized protein n=1 Tax=Arthrobacter livingstonensis TaxID=670078 RepID=A0A2V5L3I1_9MICC|nr:hypothetical protein [Arthrobacter livingstonensis]PYI64674.1 hypothetical protein CVV68_21275 [Arthrobacter livingstonensis]
MTGLLGIMLAAVAALTVSSRPRMAVILVVPFVLICGFQTWGLAVGLGVNPKDTVSQFSYYAVQLIILVLALVAADQIRIYRLWRGWFVSAPAAKPVAGSRPDSRSRVSIGLGMNLLLCVVVGTVDYLLNSSAARQSGEGVPPIAGVVGIVLLPLAILVFGSLNLLRSGRTKRA